MNEHNQTNVRIDRRENEVPSQVDTAAPDRDLRRGSPGDDHHLSSLERDSVLVPEPRAIRDWGINE